MNLYFLNAKLSTHRLDRMLRITSSVSRVLVHFVLSHSLKSLEQVQGSITNNFRFVATKSEKIVQLGSTFNPP